MSSVGQVVGGIIGGVVGFFAGGNVMLGASIGMAIGGYIDPPPGQKFVGPRLEDLTVQTSTYGAVLPRIKGTVAVTGNVFWLEGDRIVEHSNTEKVGGKGGPSSTSTTFSYSATFAIGLAHCITAPVTGIKRLWLGNTLVYDAGSDDLQSVIASNLQAGVIFKFYSGADDQQPDPRMQADKGISNVSGYPGRAYIVFYDLDLTEHYNNSLMGVQAKVEIVNGSSYIDIDLLHTLNDSFGTYRDIYSAVISRDSMTVGVFAWDSWDGSPLYVQFHDVEYGVTEGITSMSTTAYLPSPSGSHCLTVTYSDTPIIVIIEGIGYDGTQINVRWYPKGGVELKSLTYPASLLPYGLYTVAVSGVETFFAYSDGSRKLYKWSGLVPDVFTTENYAIEQMGISESYLFGVLYTNSVSSTTTVYKFDRQTLDLISTYTQTADGQCANISVVSDTLFYTLSPAGRLYKWVNGVVVEDFGIALQSKYGAITAQVWFKVFSESPFFGVSVLPSVSDSADRNAYIGHEIVSATSAKLRDIVTEECALAGISSADLDLTELVNSDVRGYRVSSAGSVRTVLEQLQAAFPFDVIQSGYKLKFKSRGGASALTVPETDLGAHTGNDVPSRFMLTTEMPSQVPAKVTFNFLNADREYDPDEQAATFTAQDVKNSYTVSLPLVMTPTEALQAADVLLRKEQVERTTAGTFWLPPTDDYRKLEAADVIDVIAQGRTHTLRLTKVTQLPDGRVECDGKLTASAAYTSTALAQSSLVLGQTLVPLAGSSRAIFLDMPLVVQDQNALGEAAIMYGFTDGWPGGVLFRTLDGGQSWSAVTGFTDRTEVFTSTNSIGAARSDIVDTASVLTVTPTWTGADLFSITEAQLFAGGNVAAYGAPGRWEIVYFKTAALSSGVYTLTNFIRGRFGTEWAMTLHETGDKLVMLDANIVQFLSLPAAALNAPVTWRAVTAGATIDSAPDQVETYAGVNLKPLSPVDLNGNRNVGTQDWSLSWVRRSRFPVNPFSGVDTPLGESSESYIVEIWNSDYTVLKRTISGLTTPETSYSSANQITDFGSRQATLYLKIYQVSATVGRGFPLVSSIYRYNTALADGFDDFALTLSPTLYLKLDDSGTTLVDSSTTASNATASGTGVAYHETGLLSGSYGYSVALKVSSTYGYITAPHRASFNGAFTAVMIVKPNTLSPRLELFHHGNNAINPSQGFEVYINSSGYGCARWYNGAWYNPEGTVALISAGEKKMLSVTYDGATTLKFFVDGVLADTLTLATAFPTNTIHLTIGAIYADFYTPKFDGNLDEFLWFGSVLSDANILALYNES